jgi:hypothetical protein
MRKVRWLLGALWLVTLPSIAPQPACPQEPPRTRIGGLGIRETVDEINARERAKKSAAMPRQASRHLRKLWRPKGKLPSSPAPRAAQSLPKPPPLVHPFAPQTASTSFLAAQTSDGGLGITPLDAIGAVSPTQILVCTNGTIKVFDRSGNLGALDVATDSFFGSVLSNGSTTDVRVRYDFTSGRWFVMCLDGDMGTTPNSFLIAVSDVGVTTITGSSSFTFFKFTAGLTAGAPAAATFADSDGIGIDVNAIYVGVNLFSAVGNFVGSAGFVVRKSSILGAGPVVVTSFPVLCDSGFAGAFSPQGVDNDDPAAIYGYFVGVDGSTTWGSVIPSLTTKLYLIRIKDPGGSPTIDNTFTLGVPPYGFSYGNDVTFGPSPEVGVPIQGSAVVAGITAGVDDLDARLTVAQIQNGSLWTVHNIDVDATGTASFSGGRDGARWYEITNLASLPPTLAQSGTLFDPATSNPASYFVPSLAVSRQGHMALGSTRGASNEYAEIAAAGRLAGDPSGALQAATVLQTSTTSYNFDVHAGLDPPPPPGSPPVPQRWGDYSFTCVDPTDGMTLWTFQEYGNAVDSMGVRVVRLLAPPPATPTSAFPASINSGISSILVSISASSSAGSGFFEPGASFPNHFAAGVSGGVLVNRVVVVDPTHVTLDLDTRSATPGAVSVTLTNPDGQSVNAPAILSVTAPSATAATITQVTSTGPNGTYGTGALIPLTVAFSEAVSVTGGTPTLALSSGGSASYSGGSGSASLSFSYTVAAGQGTGGQHLDVLSNLSLILNGASIQSGGIAANLNVPVGATSSPPWSLSSQTSILIDTTPPVTTIIGNPPNPSNLVQPTFSYSSNQAGCTFQIQLDGGPWVPKGTASSTQVGPLADGSHTFLVRATDPLGNVEATPPSYTWTIDTVPPVTTINTEPPNPDTNASPTFSYSANKPNCVFQTKIDAGAWSVPNGLTSETLGPLGSGTHTVSVRATDPAGNTDPAPPSYTWVLNVPAPVNTGSGHGGGGCGATGLEGLALAWLLGRLRRRA